MRKSRHAPILLDTSCYVWIIFHAFGKHELWVRTCQFWICSKCQRSRDFFLWKSIFSARSPPCTSIFFIICVKKGRAQRVNVFAYSHVSFSSKLSFPLRWSPFISLWFNTTPKVCVDGIQIPATWNVYVDKFQSLATEKVCVDKIRSGVYILDYKFWTTQLHNKAGL